MNKLWYVSEKAAYKIRLNKHMTGSVYWKNVIKYIGKTPVIVCKVCGKTDTEANEIAAHVVGMHNYFIDTHKNEQK